MAHKIYLGLLQWRNGAVRLDTVQELTEGQSGQEFPVEMDFGLVDLSVRFPLYPLPAVMVARIEVRPAGSEAIIFQGEIAVGSKFEIVGVHMIIATSQRVADTWRDSKRALYS